MIRVLRRVGRKSVVLQSTSRHHAEGGYWGDQLMPIVVKQKA